MSIIIVKRFSNTFEQFVFFPYAYYVDCVKPITTNTNHAENVELKQNIIVKQYLRNDF